METRLRTRLEPYPPYIVHLTHLRRCVARLTWWRVCVHGRGGEVVVCGMVEVVSHWWHDKVVMSHANAVSWTLSRDFSRNSEMN